MGDVAKEGRTVLFVSHNMAALQSLCSSAILLNDGRIESQGDVNTQIALYLNMAEHESEVRHSTLILNTAYRLSPTLTLTRFTFTPNPVDSGGKLKFKIEIANSDPEILDALVILIYSLSGTRVAILDLRKIRFPFHLNKERLNIEGIIKTLPLVEGEYQIGLYLECNEIRKDFLDIIHLQVRRQYGKDEIVPYLPRYRGFLELDFGEIRID